MRVPLVVVALHHTTPHRSASQEDSCSIIVNQNWSCFFSNKISSLVQMIVYFK